MNEGIVFQHRNRHWRRGRRSRHRNEVGAVPQAGGPGSFGDEIVLVLAVTTRPGNMGGYSLGLSALVEDSEDAWFGHGGAWGTNCMVNWHKKELRMWVIQSAGGPQPWYGAMEEAAKKFFAQSFNSSGVDAYTGRIGGGSGTRGT